MVDPIRLVLIDDDPLVRAGLKLLLGGDAELTIVAEGEDGDDVLPLVQEHEPDVVLMDIRMARVDGLTATSQLLTQPDPPKVIVLTTFDSDDLVLRALGIGASGFLLKDTPPADMIHAIKQVAAGEQTLSPSVVSQVIDVATKGLGYERREQARAELALLNNRETEVAMAIARGATNAEISRDLNFSISSVKSTVTQVLDKLGLTNRVQVAIKVHDAGWLDD